jgi:esterase/lipase
MIKIRNMIQWFIIVIIIIILLFVFIYNVINQNEDKILFFPSRRKGWKPDVPYKEVYLNIKDNNDICYSKKEKRKDQMYICCWHFNNFKGRPIFLFAHGTTGTINNRSYIINFCHKFKFNLLLFDYSGYGESCGSPHKLLLRENAETVHNYLNKVENIPNEDIILWAESLGCLSASYLCSKYKFGGLILLCAFSSLDDILLYQLDGYKRTAAGFLTTALSYKMDFLPVKDYLYLVKCPIVIIHSKDDEIIPYECAKINYRSIPHKNKLLVNIAGTHSSPKFTTKQLRRVFRFCDIPDDLSSGTINHILKDIETFAKRHNNFMSTI